MGKGSKYLADEARSLSKTVKRRLKGEDVGLLESIIAKDKKTKGKTEVDVPIKKEDQDLLKRIKEGTQAKSPKLKVTGSKDIMSGGPGEARPKDYGPAGASRSETKRLGEKFITGKNLGKAAVAGGTAAALTGDIGPTTEEPAETPPSTEEPKPVTVKAGETREDKEPPKQEESTPEPEFKMEDVTYKDIQAVEPDYENYDSSAKLAEAMQQMDKSIDRALIAYREERDLVRRRRIWENLSQGFLKMAAGYWGLKNDVAMDVEFDKTDWAQEFAQVREGLDVETAAAEKKYRGRKEGIEAKARDVNALNAHKRQVFSQLQQNARFNKQMKMEADKLNQQAKFKSIEDRRKRWETQQDNAVKLQTALGKSKTLGKEARTDISKAIQYITEASNPDMFGKEEANYQRTRSTVAQIKATHGIELLSKEELDRYQDDPLKAAQAMEQNIRAGALEGQTEPAKPQLPKQIDQATYDRWYSEARQMTPGLTELEFRRKLDKMNMGYPE